MLNKNTDIVKRTAEKLLENPIISKLLLSEKYKNQIAFTLAEVLITLLIIGIVASLVIPALINDTQKAEYVTKLKKESAVLQQAFKLLAMDAGGTILNNPNFNCSGSSCKTTASANAMNDFATKLNVVKNCGNDYGCWYTTSRKYLGSGEGSPNLDFSWGTNYGKAVLSDGTIMLIDIYNNNCGDSTGATPVGSPLYKSICGVISIDVNGVKGPNQMGRDYFEFWITKTGIYPTGSFNDGFTCYTNSASYNSSDGCANKVLSEGAMNY